MLCKARHDLLYKGEAEGAIQVNIFCTEHSSEQRCINFPKIWELLQKSGRQKGDKNQALYWGPIDIGDYRTKFSGLGDLTPEIYAPVVLLVRRDAESGFVSPPPPKQSRTAEMLDNKSEKLALICRVTWSWSEMVNVCIRQITILPRTAIMYAT